MIGLATGATHQKGPLMRPFLFRHCVLCLRECLSKTMKEDRQFVRPRYLYTTNPVHRFINAYDVW